MRRTGSSTIECECELGPFSVACGAGDNAQRALPGRQDAPQDQQTHHVGQGPCAPGYREQSGRSVGLVPLGTANTPDVRWALCLLYGSGAPQRRSNVVGLLDESMRVSRNRNEPMMKVERGGFRIDRVDNDDTSGRNVSGGTRPGERIPEQLPAQSLPMQGAVEGEARK